MDWDIYYPGNGLIIHSIEGPESAMMIYDRERGNYRVKASCIITKLAIYRVKHPASIPLRKAKSVVKNALEKLEKNPNDKNLELSYKMADYLMDVDGTAIYLWKRQAGTYAMIAYRRGWGISHLHKYGKLKTWHAGEWKQDDLTHEEVKKRMLQSAKRTAEKAEPQLRANTKVLPWSWEALYLS